MTESRKIPSTYEIRHCHIIFSQSQEPLEELPTSSYVDFTISISLQPDLAYQHHYPRYIHKVVSYFLSSTLLTHDENYHGPWKWVIPP